MQVWLSIHCSHAKPFGASRYTGDYMVYEQDAARQVLCDWISNSGGVAAAFDFCTKGILQEAAA